MDFKNDDTPRPAQKLRSGFQEYCDTHTRHIEGRNLLEGTH